MKMTCPDVTLLDCTLRDGSYQVDFGFTAAETASLVAELEAAGIRWIEVGHGLGLGAPGSGRVKSAETDATYIAAAKGSARRAKIGVFAMPAYATLDDLSRAAELGIDFLRFGIDAKGFKSAEPFIRHAATLGIHVTTFLMKTYTLGLNLLGDSVMRIADWGGNAIAIVDSAGGMTPTAVRDYVSIASDRTGLTIAFHGHNNLQLAVGNAIAAVEAGASIVDASLRGIGRSAGNAQIEALAIALPRCLNTTTYNAVALARLASRFIVNISMQHRIASAGADCTRMGVDIKELFQGLSYVHSGMQPTIDRVAAEMNVDSGDLTFAVGSFSGGLDVDETTVRKIARNLGAAF
jgi:4-hydroxy-2-oxovalerate aldolase